MRLLGHPGSDLDETRWKLFPGLPELFKQLGDLNNNQKHKQHEAQKFEQYSKKSQKNVIQNFKKKIVKLKFKDSRHAQLSIYMQFFVRNPIFKSKI